MAASFVQLSRNRAFALQLAVMVACIGVLSFAALKISGVSCALWCALGGGSCLAIFAFVSVRRYREVARLAEEGDDVLHNGRTVEFSQYREGDIAVLRNEISKMVAKLVRISSQLEDEKRYLADALADISHQIRTPLTAMGLTVASIAAAPDDASRARLARQVETMVDRVSWLVTTLLKIAKIDAGALKLDCSQVRVADVVARACDPLAASFDVHVVALETEVADEAVFLGDGLWMAEALQNIVKNCLEHTPEGGIVRVSAREDAIAMRIVVTDTGPGIAPEDIPHLFERFYRGSHGGDRDGSVQVQGFGIGLSLAQAIVSAQGGSLRAGNEPHGGAHFEAVFPKFVV